jgi:hypothetical protein
VIGLLVIAHSVFGACSSIHVRTDPVEGLRPWSLIHGRAFRTDSTDERGLESAAREYAERFCVARGRHASVSGELSTWESRRVESLGALSPGGMSSPEAGYNFIFNCLPPHGGAEPIPPGVRSCDHEISGMPTPFHVASTSQSLKAWFEQGGVLTLVGVIDRRNTTITITSRLTAGVYALGPSKSIWLDIEPAQAGAISADAISGRVEVRQASSGRLSADFTNVVIVGNCVSILQLLEVDVQ